MEKPFIRVREIFVNLQAISYVEPTEDGGVAVTVMNRDTPIRMNRDEGSAFLDILTRFTVPSRGV